MLRVWSAQPGRLRSAPLAGVLTYTLRGLMFGALLGLAAGGGNARAEAVRVEVRDVVVDPTRGTPVVLLAGGGRVLPIWIGRAEAGSIARALAGERLPRPDTHDLIQSVLRDLDAELERVTVTELREGTFYAVLTLKTNWQRIRLDARPSDAIAVALRTGAPIYATSEVLQQAVRLDEGEPETPDRVAQTLGMQVQDLTADLARLFGATVDSGALVAHVERGGPAARIGLRRGDVVVQVDGAAVKSSRDLLEKLHPPTTERARVLSVQRDGRSVTVMMNLPSGEGAGNAAR